MDGSDLVCLCIVYSDWIFGLVVAKQDLVVLEVYGLASDVVPEELFDGSFDADVPEVDCSVPAATQEYVRVIGIPLEAKYSVLVVAEMPGFELRCLSLVEMADQDLAELSCEGVVAASGADLASLQHFLILDSLFVTFLWKRSWREVACQYSSVPSEWVAMQACLKLSLFGLKARPVTGELSFPLSTYCTFSVSREAYSGWRRRSL